MRVDPPSDGGPPGRGGWATYVGEASLMRQSNPSAQRCDAFRGGGLRYDCTIRTPTVTRHARSSSLHSAARLECGRKPCGARFLRDRADARRTNRMAPGAARCRWPQQHGQSRTLFGQSQRGSGKGPLRQPRAPGVIPLTRLQGLSQSSPSKTSRTDQALAQYIWPSIANSCARDNVQVIEYPRLGSLLLNGKFGSDQITIASNSTAVIPTIRNANAATSWSSQCLYRRMKTVPPMKNERGMNAA